MRYSKVHKEETRRKILEAASRLFRDKGYDGVGVDAIMQEVGLTSGGFYAHFTSKEALFAEAFGHAYDARRKPLPATLKSPGADESLQNLIYGYLSRSHRDHQAEGCPFPALTTDVVRGSDETRKSYEQRLKKFIAAIESQIAAGSAPERERAIGVLVQLVGGVLLSRAVKDEKLSGDILKACRQAALTLINK